MNKRNTKLMLAVAVSAALVTGCGSGSGDGGGAAQEPAPDVGQYVAAVVSYISDLIASAPENGDPVNVNRLTLAEDDNAEPETIN